LKLLTIALRLFRISLTVLKFCCVDLNTDVVPDTTSNTRNSVSCKQLAKAMEMQQKRAKVMLEFQACQSFEIS